MNKYKGGIAMKIIRNRSITFFRDDYFFLSNFYEVPITYNGITYRSSEAAFQSMKAKDESLRKDFANLTPNESKKLGRKVNLREDWEDVKVDIMYEIVKQKFIQNPDLKDKLIATGNAYLEEGNTWGDKVWGTVNGEGFNHLGFILMKIREELKES